MWLVTKYLLLFFVCFGELISYVNCRPFSRRNNLPSQPPITNDYISQKSVRNFLSQYGYLGYNGPNQFLPGYRLGIRTFQLDYGLNPTGRLDKTTEEFINVNTKARCGVPDIAPPSNFVLSHRENGHGWQKWTKQNLTYYFPKELDEMVHYNREEFARELRKAFDKWSEVTNLNFIEIPRKHDADIKIAFGRKSHEECQDFGGTYFDFDGPIPDGPKLAHAYSPQHQLKGRLHFDAEENWNTEHHFQGIINDEFKTLKTFHTYTNFNPPLNNFEPSE